jgi:hypothetical protein
MKIKKYSENRSTKLIVSAKKIKVYTRTINGYRYSYSIRKGYKQAKILFTGMDANNLSIIDKVTGLRRRISTI